MRNQAFISVLAVLICIISFFGFTGSQSCDPITRTQLRQMINQLGYTVSDINKEPGKEKFSIVLQKAGLDIPVAVEISPSNTYVWLTVNLGPAQNTNAAKNYGLLRQTAVTGPSHFYVTEGGTQMMGLAIENRGITNAILRERIESIATKVGDNKTYWQ